MWDNLLPYKKDAEWLKEVELELENVRIEENVEKNKEDVRMQLRKMLNWKAPGLEREKVLNENIQSLSITSWLVKSRTALIQKDPAKGNVADNYRPIACLNIL